VTLAESVLRGELQCVDLTADELCVTDARLVQCSFVRARVRGRADFFRADFAGRAHFRRAVVEGPLGFGSCTFSEILDASEIECGDLELGQIRRARGVLLDGACISGRATLDASVFDGGPGPSLSLEQATLGGAVSLVAARFTGVVTLAGSKLHGSFAASDAILAGGLVATGLRADGPFSVARAHVGGRLDLSDAVFSDRLDFEAARLDGGVRVSRVRSTSVLLRWSQVRGRLQTAEPDPARGQADLAAQYAWLQGVFEGQGLYGEQDQAYFLHRRHARRARGHDGRRLGSRLEWALAELGTGYGTRPQRVALLALLVIVGFALLYWALPGEFMFVEEVVEAERMGADRLGGLFAESAGPSVGNFAEALLYSFDVFSSLGLGGVMTRYLSPVYVAVAIEGLLGLLLTTAFVGTVLRKFLRMS